MFLKYYKNLCVPCVPSYVPFFSDGTHAKTLPIKPFSKSVYHVYHLCACARAQKFNSSISIAILSILIIPLNCFSLTCAVNGTHGTHGTHPLVYIALLCVPLFKMVHTMVHIQIKSKAASQGL